jgi:DNA-binding response OmpR family regulator
MPRILIVDDDPSIRTIVAKSLEQLPFAVGTELASNGMEAVDMAGRDHPDLIVLDVMMPEMDGFEVCRQFRADPVLAQVPVIMVTALDDNDSIIRGIEAGADDFISKPFNHAELKARVKNITRLNRYRRLLAAQAKFEWVVERAADGYLVVDEQDNILYANSQARLYLGLSNDQNKPITKLFLELARRQYHFQPEEAWVNWPQQPPPVNERPSPRYLVRPESPAAHAFWLQLEILDLPASPPEGQIIQLSDVTSQMSIQHDMWEFQSLVSHKLRTPLGGVVTGLELLASDYGIEEHLTAEMTDLFDLIFKSAQDLKRDILNIFQHTVTSKSTPPGTKIDISQVESLITQICTDLELTAVTVNNQISPGSEYVSLSEQSIELILREILGNAKKFHPAQSPTIEIALSATGNKNINLQISDDGLNLPLEKLNRLWIPYYQSSKYFTGQIEGMGLGLSRVASLVWSAGGTVRLDNREAGPGIVVTLILPASKKGTT